MSEDPENRAESGVNARRPELPEQPREPGFGGWDERQQHSPDRCRFVRKLKNERMKGRMDDGRMDDDISG